MIVVLGISGKFFAIAVQLVEILLHREDAQGSTRTQTLIAYSTKRTRANCDEDLNETSVLLFDRVVMFHFCNNAE